MHIVSRRTLATQLLSKCMSSGKTVILAAHFDHPNYGAMLEAFSNVGLVESTNRAYLTERNEPVYGPNFEKRTEFFV